MRRRRSSKRLRIGLGLIALALLPAQALAADAPAQTVRAVKPGFYMVSGGGANVTVWVTDHGLILVDDKLPGEGNFDALVEAIRGISKRQVLAVFNTSFAEDHAGNNCRFSDAGVMVIASNRGEAEAPAAPQTPCASSVQPNVQFGTDFSLIMMQGRADAYHLPGAGARDAIVYFPAANLVAAGDLMRPFDPAEGRKSAIEQRLKALDALLALDFDLAIPGHGAAPLSRADVVALRAAWAGRAHQN